jgi:hypothetical protein
VKVNIYKRITGLEYILTIILQSIKCLELRFFRFEKSGRRIFIYHDSRSIISTKPENQPVPRPVCEDHPALPLTAPVPVRPISLHSHYLDRNQKYSASGLAASTTQSLSAMLTCMTTAKGLLIIGRSVESQPVDIFEADRQQLLGL